MTADSSAPSGLYHTVGSLCSIVKCCPAWQLLVYLCEFATNVFIADSQSVR